MLYADLLEAKTVGTASNAGDLQKLLDEAIVGSDLPFAYIDAVSDAPMSCRILLQVEIPELTKTSPLPRPYRSRAAAKNFFVAAMMTQSRYKPPTPPSPEMRKGWEVSVAVADGGQKIVIVKATWCV